jgi:hypothetical protein
MAVRDSSPLEHRFERALPIARCAVDLRFTAPNKYGSLMFGAAAGAFKTNSGSGT